jgi:hypothetical protein
LRARAPEETEPVPTRLPRVVRVAALALLLPASGCCTTYTWAVAPRVRPERLIGARVDESGGLAIGVELNDGRRLVYRAPTVDRRYVSSVTMATEPDVDAATWSWPCTPDEHGVITLQPAPNLLAGTADPELVDPHGEFGRLFLRTKDRKDVVSLELPETDEIRWEHPGTWLCVVATPVTAAVDVVTFPVQVIVLVCLHPGM